MKFKKSIISIFLAASMLTFFLLSGCSSATNNDSKDTLQEVVETGSVAGVKEADTDNAVIDKEINLVKSDIPMWYLKSDDKRSITLYFTDEGKEIPYLDADTVRGLLDDIFHDVNLDKGFLLDLKIDGNTAIFTRENGYTMEIDCEKDAIHFMDYDAFLMPSYSPTVIDVLEHYGLIPCLKQVEESSYSRYGTEVVFDMAKYGINLIATDGMCYVPMQSVSDLLTSLQCYVSFYYNGYGVFINEYGSASEKKLMKKYYKTGVGDEKRSKELAEFNYRELCVVLDSCYGLKEQHGITGFDEFFMDTGLKERLLSEDITESSKAIYDLVYLYLSDGHSSYVGNSWRIGRDAETQGGVGKSFKDLMISYMDFTQARGEVYPDGTPGYEEIGNTAYITFDQFHTMPSDADYYKTPPTLETTDTVGICLYAFSQIKREGSPIENVVLDMSTNLGGDSTTASFVLSMFLGEASICLEDTLTGAYMNEAFCCDANLDRKFDENDSLQGYRLFCLTSPFSFSCGNLVPSVLQASEKVKIIGMKSGGGACIVMPLSTADGTRFDISGNRRLGYMKNGAVYNIDQGVNPDYPISVKERFYDRKSLTDYINSIY